MARANADWPSATNRWLAQSHNWFEEAGWDAAFMLSAESPQNPLTVGPAAIVRVVSDLPFLEFKHGACDAQIWELKCPTKPAPSICASLIRIHTVWPEINDQFEIETRPSDTISDVKCAIYKQRGYDLTWQRLLFRGKLLLNAQRLDSSDLVWPLVLNLIVVRPPPATANTATATDAVILAPLSTAYAATDHCAKSVAHATRTNTKVS